MRARFCAPDLCVLHISVRARTIVRAAGVRAGEGMAYDAIVVGAGHNGLASAIHLAAKGWKVGVFEAAEQPGGAVRTAEITLPGFRHDLYAMNLSLFAGSPFFAAHRDGLIRHGLAFVP